VQPSVSDANQAMIEYIDQNGGTIAAFDGDAISDTPPDPSPVLYAAHGQNFFCTQQTITVSGTLRNQSVSFTFTPDVGNVMSYYKNWNCSNPPVPQHFSPLQIQQMISTLNKAPRNALLCPTCPPAPQCQQVTGCISPSFWEFSLSCSGEGVGMVYNGNCTNTSGEPTPCYAGFNGSSLAQASWFGAPGPPLFQTASSQETATVCTSNSSGNTCITVNPVNLPACPGTPSEPPPACPTGEKLCDGFNPPRCVPVNECLVDPATPH
jgi:hypothetical protein